MMRIEGGSWRERRFTMTAEEADMRDGRAGPATALAMRIVLTAARTLGAARLLPISSAHVDSCLYHGPSSLDFVRALTTGGGRVAVPTTLNVGGIDLAHRDLFRGPADQADAAAALMEEYVTLGCQPTFTCAPYQLPGRPGFGQDVAWAESNAIVFGNSVVGLRTNRYGDLMDICAAVTGRVPAAGLHLPQNRHAQIVFTIEPDVAAGVDPDLLPALLGHHVGRAVGTRIPALIGLPADSVDEDWMKAFGAAAASSGGVAMFHVVGVTPEAPDLAAAVGASGRPDQRTVTVADLLEARRDLTTGQSDARLGGVSLGTPHASARQLRAIADHLDGRPVRVPTYVSTSRRVLASVSDAADRLAASGVGIVLDTCTYISAIMRPDGAVMTNSAKWAYYAPANLGFDVVLASQTECLDSALAGRIRLAPR